MKRLSIFSITMLISGISFGEPLEPIELWPEGKIPDEAELKLPEEKVELRGANKIEIMSNVSVPTMTWYPAPAEKNTGTTIVVCPGGAYNILAYSHEGKEVCEWLNSIGVNGVLLKYRVPRREGLDKHHAPLQDVHRAIGMIRSNKSWRGMAKRVGVLGFSAGGHLSTMALTSDGERTYEADPEVDAVSCVPDFAVLIYPAYLQDSEMPDKLSPEVKVSGKTPPAFIVVAHGDKKFVEGSAILYLAMRRKDRDCELHIYGKGGHGFGFANTSEVVATWSKRAEDWLRAMKYIK